MIKFYKDAVTGNWCCGKKAKIAAGTCTMEVSADENMITIYQENGSTIASGLVTNFVYANSQGQLVPYADYAELSAETADFFVKASEAAYYDAVAEAMYSYGVIIDDNLSAPDRPIRVGNQDMGKSLPLHNFKNMISDVNGAAVYYLHPTTKLLKEDGVTPSVLDGADGDVMSERDGVWFKVTRLNDKQREARVADRQLPGYSWIPRGLLACYEGSIHRPTGQLRSVKNASVEYRGGNNVATNDANSKTFLQRPATSLSLTQFRTAARVGRSERWSPISYFERWIRTYMYWIEYANTNTQAPVVGRNTVTGYMEGGLGNGVTNANGTEWNNFNGSNPFIPIGVCDALGNGSGEVSYTALDFGGPGINRTFTVPCYRGVENIFGHIWEWHDGILIDVKTDASGGTSSLFTCNDPAKFSSTITADYTFKGLLPRTEDFIREMIHGEIMPSRVGSGAGSTTFYCDRFWRDINSNAIRGVVFGGAANDGSNAGLVTALTLNAPSLAATHFGSRLCFI